MSQQNPLVTVYVATRNRSTLLSRAIRSIVAQDFEPIEIVVVDDASQDDTESVVKKIALGYAPGKTVRYHKLKSQAGAGAARNLAIQLASGSLVTGLDDDDYFLPDRISRLVTAFDPARCAFVFDGYVRETVLGEGRTRRTTIPLRQPANLGNLLKRNIVGNQVMTLTARLREIGGFDVGLPAWEDYELWIRLVKAFGEGKPLGGSSYVHTVDSSRPHLSHDLKKTCEAFDLFLEKHTEYADAKLQLCLRLAKTCVGINALTIQDAPALVRLREPRYVAFALYSYLANRRMRRSLR